MAVFLVSKRLLPCLVSITSFGRETIPIFDFDSKDSMDGCISCFKKDLWTMCTAVLIQGRVLDVLVGGAVGAGNPKLGGIYLQVALVVISVVAVGVFVFWNVTEQVWLAFGSDPEISRMAGYYARILSFSIPGQFVFTQLSQFFSAQRIMHPEVNASTFALVCNLFFGLIFVLGIPFKGFGGYGFKACPIVTSIVVYVQLLLFWFVYIYKQRLHADCWDKWAWNEITWPRIKTFSGLYFPSAFGMASDFWRVAVSKYLVNILRKKDPWFLAIQTTYC